MTPEWAEALHARRRVLEQEIEERRAELAQVNRELLRAVVAPSIARRRRSLEVMPLRRAPSNPPYFATPERD